MKPTTPSGYDTDLKNGTIRSARGGMLSSKPDANQATTSWIASSFEDAGTANARYTAVMMPISDCQKNLSRADMPFGFLCTTLR